MCKATVSPVITMSDKLIRLQNCFIEYIVVVSMILFELVLLFISSFLSFSDVEPVNIIILFLSFNNSFTNLMYPSFVHFLWGYTGPQPVFNKNILFLFVISYFEKKLFLNFLFSFLSK